MIILVVLVAAIGLALLRGGSLANLSNVRLRFYYLLFVPLGLQLIIFSPLASDLPPGVPYAYIASMLVGAVVVWFNRKLPGFGLLLAGLLSNLVVILLNGGFMPVSMAARALAGLPLFRGVYNNVVEMTRDSNLWFLADIIPVPGWLPLGNVFSLGDLLIALGGFEFIRRTLASTDRGATTAPTPAQQRQSA